MNTKFGLIINNTSSDGSIPDWKIEFHQKLLNHSYIVFRNVTFDNTEEMIEFSKTIGDTVEYAFGKVLDIKNEGKGKQTQLSNRAMCIHQDSVLPDAFADIIMLYCRASPKKGGESLLCDNRKFLEILKNEDQELYDFFVNTKVKYMNHTPEYYSGDFDDNEWIIKNSMRKHGVLNIDMPYFAFNDFRDPLRNFTAIFDGLSEEQSDSYMQRLDNIIRREDVMVEHNLEVGDLIIVDNSLVSHGRNGYPESEYRQLSRVQIEVRKSMSQRLKNNEEEELVC